MKVFATILDKTGSVYIGRYDADVCVGEDNCLALTNPAQIIFKPDEQTKEVEISIFPVCYPEILSESVRLNGSIWYYDIKEAKFINYDSQLNDRIIAQYDKVFSNQ